MFNPRKQNSKNYLKPAAKNPSQTRRNHFTMITAPDPRTLPLPNFRWLEVDIL